MGDLVLAFVVVIAPTVFAIGIEVIDRRIRERPYWRFGIIGFGLALSGLTWLQLSRETTARENAIRDTSQQVAAETSKQVTRAVTEQYSQMVADQKSQIADLQNKLASQAKDVSLIKRSNIVTGKNPIKVEVTNEPSSIGSPSQTEAEKKKRAEVRTHLGILLGEATAVKRVCLTDPPPEKFSCVDSANDWARRTLTYIEQNLEQSYQPRFSAATGLSLSYNGAKTEQINNVVNYLTFKAAILEQFIKEFRD